jgi:hypothetical protein
MGSVNYNHLEALFLIASVAIMMLGMVFSSGGLAEDSLLYALLGAFTATIVVVSLLCFLVLMTFELQTQGQQTTDNRQQTTDTRTTDTRTTDTRTTDTRTTAVSQGQQAGAGSGAGRAKQCVLDGYERIREEQQCSAVRAVSSYVLSH